MQHISVLAPTRSLQRWFRSYASSFKAGDKEHIDAIVLKQQHSLRVLREIRGLARDIGLNATDQRIAEAAALLHDIGRFEQFKMYRTMVDRLSVNHAGLGVHIVRQSGILDSWSRSARTTILNTIAWHNRAELPRSRARWTFFARLVRDADKLDIFRVVTTYYEAKKLGAYDKTIELGLPDTPVISSRISADVAAGNIAQGRDVRTLSDFKLLQMAWVYDVNFKRTFRLIRRRRYLEKIRDSLPQTTQVGAAFHAAYRYVREQFRRPRR